MSHVLIAVLAIFAATVSAFLLSLLIGTIVYIARLERGRKAVDAAVAEERACQVNPYRKLTDDELVAGVDPRTER